MASKPIERFVRKQIQDQGGWTRLLDRYASGEDISKLARSLQRPDGLPISRQFLYRLIHQVPGLLQQFQALKSQCAAAVFEKGLAAADDMPADRDAILRDKARADIYFRGAALIDRDQFGTAQPALNVTLNVASLHVDALRHHIPAPAQPDPTMSGSGLSSGVGSGERHVIAPVGRAEDDGTDRIVAA